MCIFPFPKKGYHGLAKNYRGITLTSIAANIYNAPTPPHRTQNWEDTLEEPKWLSEKSIHDITDFDYPLNTRRCTCEISRGNNIICWLLQGLWLHSQGKNGANSTRLPNETIAAIMILYKNTEVKVRSPDGDTDCFDIVAGVLQGDTLAPFLFII